MGNKQDQSLVTGKLDRSLIAYAFLAQATRCEGDLLGGLAPIFKPIAKIFAGKRFDPKVFAQTLGEIYGLKVNSWAIEDMAPRLEQAGVLAKVMLAEGVHDYVYAEITEEFNDVTEQDIAMVVRRFVDFATPLLKQHGKAVDARQLEVTFLRQLVDMEFVGILLKPEILPPPEHKEGTITLKKAPVPFEREDGIATQARLDVLCASFILDTYNKDQSLYEFIVRLATGALVSEVVLNFQDPGSAISLENLNVILDTPFLMAALDLSDKEAHLVAGSLCEELQNHGAQLAVFSHSVDELQDNLKAVINEVDAGRGFGATARRLPNQTFHAYAASLLQNLEARLKQDSIRVIAPLTSVSSQQYFTSADEDELGHGLGYFNKLSQERDAASIAGVIRLRSNRRARMGQFPAARYILLTSNPRLADRSRQYMVDRNVYSDGDVPPAISDRYFAGLMWVVYGGKSKELPTHVLLANCAKAIEPRSDVIRQMHKFLSEMDGKQAEYFHALMTDERAGQHLMQLTLGESTFLTRDNAPAILEQMKNALVEKHEAKTKEEIERITAEHETQLSRQHEIQNELRNNMLEVETSEYKARQELRETNRRVEKLEGAIAAEKSARILKRKRVVERCIRTAISRTNAAHFLISACVASVGALVAWLGIPESPNPIVKAVGSVVIWVVAFVSFWKVPDYLLGSWMKRFREKTYRKKLAELGDEGDVSLFDIDWENGLAVVKVGLDQQERLASVDGSQ